MTTVESLREEFIRRFGGEPALYRSPGRVNLIGEHTDYNEGFVLPAAIDRSMLIAVAPRADRSIGLYAVDRGEGHEADLDRLERSTARWPDYLLGCALPISGESFSGIGCAGSFDDRNIEVAISLVSLLKSSGIPFWILGTEEGCCGDPARKTGNEYLFQMLAEANIKVLHNYRVNQILTLCPHCLHTLKNEYPQFGGKFDVIHYTQFFADLLSKGKLKPTKPINKVITYHDSCYLGRGNQIYDAPRKILQSIPGLKLIEMERHGRRSFCCGAGGGRMWMEENIGRRINQIRTHQALETKVALLGTACPYCLTMLSDGVKEMGHGDTVKVFDLSELLEESV